MFKGDYPDGGLGRPYPHLDKIVNQVGENEEIVPECNAIIYNQNSKGENCTTQNNNELKNHSDSISRNYGSLKEETVQNIVVSKEWPPVFGILDLLFAICGLIVFVFDLITDWLLAYKYYNKQDILPLIITVSFIVIPSVISGVISIIWYAMEHIWTKLGISKINLFFRIVFTVLQLGRVYRLIEYMIYMVKSWLCCTHDISRRRHYRQKALEQKVDAAILGLIDGFLESALQLVLQLYLSMKFHIQMDAQRVITIVLSWLSTALTLTSYYRDNRKARQEKIDIGYTGSSVYFFWRICEIGPRILLLAMCGVLFMPWCFIPVTIHFVIMVVFYSCQKPELKGICCSDTSGFPFLLLVAYISIFCFVNLKDGKTKKNIVIYYLIFHTENAAMTSLILWYSYAQCKVLGNWTPSVYMFFVGSVLHLTFMLLFYKCFHPHRNPVCTL